MLIAMELLLSQFHLARVRLEIVPADALPGLFLTGGTFCMSTTPSAFSESALIPAPNILSFLD